MHELVGRHEELAAIAGFFERPLPAALLIEGDPGIGKTSLWREALREAKKRGYTVLEAGPAETEVPLPYAALGDLLDGVALDELPAPQRHAVGVALLLEEPTGTAAESRAVAVGVLRLLRALAPVVLAIDDMQWLDADSRRALEFVWRRVGDAPIALVLARRTDESAPLGLTDEDVIRLGGLSIGATAELVRTRLDVSLRRPEIRRIHETSGGNPLFALGLAGSAADTELPASLRQLVEARIADVPDEMLRMLQTAAALTDPRVELVGHVEVDPEIAVIEDGRIRFAHPLLRSAVYARADADERRRLHARLAELDLPLEERARHVALAGGGVDEAAADVLEAGAWAAALRGAPEVAAQLALEAARRSDPAEEDAVRRRRYLAADELIAAGDVDRGRQELEVVLAATPHGATRARTLLRLAKHPRDLAESAALCEEALLHVGDDAALRCDVLTFLAKLTIVLDPGERAEELLAEAFELGDEVRRANVRIVQSALAYVNGQPFDRAAFDEARSVDEALVERRSMLEDRATYFRALIMLNAGELDAARFDFQELERIALETGDEPAQADILGALAKIELEAGDWAAARRHDDAAVELAEEIGLDHILLTRLADRAYHRALAGELDPACEDAARALELAGQVHDHLSIAWAREAFAQAAHQRGDNETARAELETVLETAPLGAGGIRMAADAVELFPLPDAAHLAAEIEAVAATLGVRKWEAIALRARGIVDADVGALQRAVALGEEVGIPYDHARSLLALGRVQRRGRQRKAARETLEAALAIFEELGAPGWAAITRAEIARIGGRAATPSSLTPTEERVAALVAQGRSNSEVADALVVSVRAVEANLTRIYSKLGIRSRTELAARYRD